MRTCVKIFFESMYDQILGLSAIIESKLKRSIIHFYRFSISDCYVSRAMNWQMDILLFGKKKNAPNRVRNISFFHKPVEICMHIFIAYPLRSVSCVTCILFFPYQCVHTEWVLWISSAFFMYFSVHDNLRTYFLKAYCPLFTLLTRQRLLLPALLQGKIAVYYFTNNNVEK